MMAASAFLLIAHGRVSRVKVCRNVRRCMDLSLPNSIACAVGERMARVFPLMKDHCSWGAEADLKFENPLLVSPVEALI
jgi:hypothetical protein